MKKKTNEIMGASQTTVSSMYSQFKLDSGDDRITQTEFIQRLNNLLQGMGLTKPAEQVTKIYYCKDRYNYALPSAGYREAIGLYCDTAKIIRYVSPLRWRLEEPLAAYTDQGDGGKRFLKIRNPFTESQESILTQCDSLTADGTWTVSDGQTPTINTTTYKKGSGSLSFSITAAATITLTFAKTAVIDASAYTKYLRLRLYAWLPTSPSSVTIKLGNEASNYFSQTITAQASGEAFTTEDENELEFCRNGATETGTVDITSIDYFSITITFASATTDTEFLLNGISIFKPEVMDFEWYTNYVGMTSAGVLQENITESDSTDDEPIIKDFPDYIKAVINGLLWEHFKNKAPEQSGVYKSLYYEEKAGRRIVGGLSYLEMRYPSRRASYKRIKTLPSLYKGRIRGTVL